MDKGAFMGGLLCLLSCYNSVVYRIFLVNLGSEDVAKLLMLTMHT